MDKDISGLEKKANGYRKKILEMIYKANAGHPGGSLSVIDILTVIFSQEIDFDSEERSRVQYQLYMPY